MSLTIVAAVLALLTTGITSLISHPLTMLGGAAASVGFVALGLLSRGARIHPGYVVAPPIMLLLVLISSEHNISPVSSTIHLLSCYVAFLGLAGTFPEFFDVCQRVCLLTYLVLVAMVLGQTLQTGAISSWSVKGAAGTGNLMAAQLNMTMPLMLLMAGESEGIRRIFLRGLVGLGMLSVVFVGSRNGIGSLLILITLASLFHHRKLAFLLCSVITLCLVFSQELLETRPVMALLARFRFVGYQASRPRSQIWSVSLDFIRESPWLGIGPGETDRALEVLDVNHAHNNYLQTSLESGLPVGLMMCLLVAGLLNIPFTAALTSRRAFLLSLSIVAYVVQSLTEASVHLPQQTLLLVFCTNLARLAIPAGQPSIPAGQPSLRSRDPAQATAFRRAEYRPG